MSSGAANEPGVCISRVQRRRWRAGSRACAQRRALHMWPRRPAPRQSPTARLRLQRLSVYCRRLLPAYTPYRDLLPVYNGPTWPGSAPCSLTGALLKPQWRASRCLAPTQWTAAARRAPHAACSPASDARVSCDPSACQNTTASPGTSSSEIHCCTSPGPCHSVPMSTATSGSGYGENVER
ncbi:uncharacterized protein LOC126297920 [Schistocerca gregaria]|uniref:uncharacterized protein LOC126297920 n=1 Tax=Schistocerca gregaria TaxID=7010 RepID=UPI00211EBC4B|nr:uncharacterized protein LOC126297920 [Schistocerca gregaria]